MPNISIRRRITVSPHPPSNKVIKGSKPADREASRPPRTREQLVLVGVQATIVNKLCFHAGLPLWCNDAGC